MLTTRRGRPSRFAEYDQLVASLPTVMGKRPRYVNGIGVFRGTRGITAWLKIRLPHGGILSGKHHGPDAAVEIKMGSLDSWSWEALTERHRDLQGRADRGEPLEEAPSVRFETFAEEGLGRAKVRARSIETERIAVRKYLLPAFGKTAVKQV